MTEFDSKTEICKKTKFKHVTKCKPKFNTNKHLPIAIEILKMHRPFFRYYLLPCRTS